MTACIDSETDLTLKFLMDHSSCIVKKPSMACKFEEETRLRIIQCYYRNGESVTAASRHFNTWRNAQPNAAAIPLCTKKNVHQLVQKFLTKKTYSCHIKDTVADLAVSGQKSAFLTWWESWRVRENLWDKFHETSKCQLRLCSESRDRIFTCMHIVQRRSTDCYQPTLCSEQNCVI